MVQALHHLGFSVDGLLETLTKLHRHGVTLVLNDHAENSVETGGLLAAADILVEARRAYRRENIVAGQLRARAAGVRFGRPPVPRGRLDRVRMAPAIRPGRAPSGSFQRRQRGRDVEDQGRDGCGRVVRLTPGILRIAKET